MYRAFGNFGEESKIDSLSQKESYTDEGVGGEAGAAVAYKVRKIRSIRPWLGVKGR
jgi:hypothetical protein